MPHQPLFSKRCFGYLLLALGLLLVTGSIIDLPLSHAAVDADNFFANFFAAFGTLPASLGAVGGGLLLLLGYHRNNTAAKIAEWIIGILAIGIGAWLSLTTPPKYSTWSDSVLVTVAAIAILVTLVFTYWLAKKSPKRATVRRVGFLLIGAILTEFILINVLKGVWERPRMRFIATRSDDLFRHWWQVGNELREYFLPMGIAPDEFKSFPSGHTGHATLMMGLALMPRLNLRWRPRQNMLLGIGIAWASLTALSRVIIGAHFLTDTVFGFAIGLFSLALFDRLLFQPNQIKQKN